MAFHDLKSNKFQIKKEPVSDSEEEPAASESVAASETEVTKNVSEQQPTRSTRVAAEKAKNRLANTSGESLYEDAVSQADSSPANVNDLMKFNKSFGNLTNIFHLAETSIVTTKRCNICHNCRRDR